MAFPRAAGLTPSCLPTRHCYMLMHFPVTNRSTSLLQFLGFWTSLLSLLSMVCTIRSYQRLPVTSSRRILLHRSLLVTRCFQYFSLWITTISTTPPNTLKHALLYPRLGAPSGRSATMAATPSVHWGVNSYASQLQQNEGTTSQT